jgi:hypothetical protein
MLRMSRRATKESKVLASVSRSPRLDAQDEQTRHRVSRVLDSASRSTRLYAQESRRATEKSIAQRRAGLWYRFQNRRVSMLSMSRRAAE